MRDFTLEFRILAVSGDWNELLLIVFHQPEEIVISHGSSNWLMINVYKPPHFVSHRKDNVVKSWTYVHELLQVKSCWILEKPWEGSVFLPQRLHYITRWPVQPASRKWLWYSQYTQIYNHLSFLLWCIIRTLHYIFHPLLTLAENWIQWPF